MSKAEWGMQGGLSLGAIHAALTGDIITAITMGWLATLAILVNRVERRDRDQWK
tara:strand:+ start:2092 stop:2253 length:162 start_codon:yes stop_codon:yes gene_type:complete